MKRKLTFALITFFLFVFLFGEKNSTIRVGLLNGPTCIPAAYLMENQKEMTFEKFADPQALLPKMIKNEIDIGFMPVNVAAKVFNSGNKAIICAAVTGQGNLSIITTDKSIRNFRQLKGKTIYTAGQGATPEYMLKYLLSKNKLTAGTSDDNDVLLDFSIPNAQIAAQLISGKITYAAVPEPFVTIAKMKSKEAITLLDFQKEYIECTGAKEIYPLSVMVVRKDFAEKNPEQLEKFLKEYEKSLEWTKKNPSAAGQLSNKHSLGLDAAVVEKAIPVSNYTFVPASKAIQSIEELLRIFLENEKTSIGGKLPENDFYYTKKNP